MNFKAFFLLLFIKKFPPFESQTANDLPSLENNRTNFEVRYFMVNTQCRCKRQLCLTIK